MEPSHLLLKSETVQAPNLGSVLIVCDHSNMAGICSKHQHHEVGCPHCKASPTDLFPDWEQKKAAAILAGTQVCAYCGFESYKTTSSCPKCRAHFPEDKSLLN